jgi:hypothetical protein
LEPSRAVEGPDGETIFPEEPEPLAATLGEFIERYGVGIGADRRSQPSPMRLRC